jgi:hypothetical protein
LFLGGVLWFLLDRHEKRRVARGLPRQSPLRLIFAAAALLTMLFSGGCSLLFLASLSGQSGGEQYVNLPLILLFGGPPFLVGLLVWLLAMRRRRPSQ